MRSLRNKICAFKSALLDEYQKYDPANIGQSPENLAEIKNEFPAVSLEQTDLAKFLPNSLILCRKSCTLQHIHTMLPKSNSTTRPSEEPRSDCQTTSPQKIFVLHWREIAAAVAQRTASCYPRIRCCKVSEFCDLTV